MKKYFITNSDPLCGISVARLDDDGIITWLGVPNEDLEYQEWLAAGNTPEPWEAPDAD